MRVLYGEFFFSLRFILWWFLGVMVSRFSLSDTGELVDSTGMFSLSDCFVEEDLVLVGELVDFLNKQAVSEKNKSNSSYITHLSFISL